MKELKRSFSVKVAVEYSVSVAIILQNIAYWVERNKQNEINYHEGRYWTYNTLEDFQELHPYYSIKTIHRAIQKLEEEQLILSGNFNETKFNRRKWYTIFDDHLDKMSKSHLDKMSKSHIGNNKEPIKDNIDFKKSEIENKFRDAEIGDDFYKGLGLKGKFKVMWYNVVDKNYIWDEGSDGGAFDSLKGKCTQLFRLKLKKEGRSMKEKIEDRVYLHYMRKLIARAMNQEWMMENGLTVGLINSQFNKLR